MTDRKEIHAAFEKAEHLAGGYANSNADEVCDTVASELGMDSADVRRVMSDHWSMAGGG